MLRAFVILCLFVLISCSKTNDPENISLVPTGKSFKTVFEKVGEIQVKINQDNGRKIYSIKKIQKLNDKYIILDPRGSAVYIIDSLGSIKAIVTQKGKGPGETLYPKDFIVDNQNNILIIDNFLLRIVKFNSLFQFQGNYQLSFQHRNPQSIGLFNNFLIISAQNNLKEGSTQKNLNFLDYDQNTFLNIYDSSYKFIKSVLNPNQQLDKTEGLFAMPWENYSPFCSNNSFLYAMTQEGFYEINIYNKNFSLIKRYSINSKAFTEISNKIKEYVFDKSQNKISEEELGRLVGGHTIPLDLKIINNYLIITFANPIDNYYPTYAKDAERNLYYDIYKINDNNLTPHYSTIKTDRRIIGIDKDLLFMIDKNIGSSQNDFIKIEIMKIK